MRHNALLAARAADFCRANHASLRDLPRETFWTAIRALPDQIARTLATSRLTAGLAVAAPAVASATNYNVTNVNDSGTGSLRQAVLDANANPGGDTITFAAGLAPRIDLTSGQLLITDALTISGPGSVNLAIDGQASSRLFYLYAAPTSDAGPNTPFEVTISGLTLQNGREASQRGGAIMQRNVNLTLDDVTLSNNVAATSNGGALFLDGLKGGTLTVQNSTFSGNTAHSGGAVVINNASGLVLFDTVAFTNNQAPNGSGGALYMYQTGSSLISFQSVTVSGNGSTQRGGGFALVRSAFVTIQDSTFSGNTSQSDGAGLLLYDVSTVSLTDTTVSGNTASGKGGGFFAYQINSMSITGSTITGNSAGGNGGGVNLYRSFAMVENCTIADNTTTARAGGLFIHGHNIAVADCTITGNSAAGDNGGGVYVKSAAQGAPIANSIIAGNTVTLDGGVVPGDTGSAGDGLILSSYNLIQNPGTAIFLNFADAGHGTDNDAGINGPGNIIWVDPLLGALADNGGPTQTRLPAANSPALNAGDPAFPTDFNFDGGGFTAPTTDQRGQTRVSGGTIDIGAVERQPSDTVADAGSDAGSSDAGSTDAGSTDAGSTSDAGTSTGNDAGSTSGADAGSSVDGGSGSSAKGCACNGTESDVALALLAPIGALLLRRRRAKA